VEKAYPEDEAVMTTSFALEGAQHLLNEGIYEKRFGATTQLELKIPFGAQELPNGWRAGLGDVSLGVKQVLHHSLERGTILSLGAEVTTPTGNRAAEIGAGTWIGEVFVAAGKMLPRDAFVQGIAEVELPASTSRAERETGFGIAAGKTWTAANWGRTWTPMVELLAARELEAGAAIAWDVVPQLQVSLSTRQHLLANVGARIPLNQSGRSTQLLVYILWDWFDGGFFDGW
jgi:hypothetical protein